MLKLNQLSVKEYTIWPFNLLLVSIPHCPSAKVCLCSVSVPVVSVCVYVQLPKNKSLEPFASVNRFSPFSAHVHIRILGILAADEKDGGVSHQKRLPRLPAAHANTCGMYARKEASNSALC